MAVTPTVSYQTAEGLPVIEQRLIDVYAEVYAEEATTDPFFSVERFTERLRAHARGRAGDARSERSTASPSDTPTASPALRPTDGTV